MSVFSLLLIRWYSLLFVEPASVYVDVGGVTLDSVFENIYVIPRHRLFFLKVDA